MTAATAWDEAWKLADQKDKASAEVFQAVHRARLATKEVLAENERLRDLVVRFRQWDDLPGRADGPYWMSEADKVLGDA